MILTHFILCLAQPPVLIAPEPATCPASAGASDVTIISASAPAGPVLRVAPAPTVLVVGRS
ncbi:hypothetical protein CHU93_10425 [Sandarakinorhabdus cyanobacteriorum]|uniref:Uncharacterized protein n=1 Tax=Sandarakinorhabdus cyanobacteriorum TaxID=1981098 RepID=A0A255YEP2_9SPHN|nr:hypothetical protein [Sandarakinorhabdus cyanobacteriorum]OYQ27671.1 hypothetical protein CHU93_10425 [Sandarakinorhabdus cyanobacteriorum]